MSHPHAGAPADGNVRLVVFDMDGVLIDHVSSWAAVHEALGTRNNEAVRAFMEGRIDDHAFILADVALWKRARPGFSAGDLEGILARVPRMPGLAEGIGSLTRAGARCAIVSGGLKELARMLESEAPFSSVRANGVVFGPDGALTFEARVEVPLRDKGSVVRALQAELGVTSRETAAVGDSAFDLGLFSESRLSVAFNPKDERVVRAAHHVVERKDLRAAVAPILEASERNG